MVTPTIHPAGSGSATVTYIGTDEYDISDYRIEATANEGYSFSYTVVKGWNNHGGSYHTWERTFRTNTATIREQHHGGYTEEIISIDVYFDIREIKYTVTTDMTPNAARGSTSGDGEYEEGTSCTVSCAAKCSLWIFDRWEFSTGETYNTKSVTFTVTADVTCTAVFRHENTGQLIYDADGSGSLICAADGSLLYNGDSVGP